MTQNEFLSKFAEQFEETDPSTILIDTNFRDIDEWNSMMALVIIAMVDEEYNVSLNGDNIRAAKTVNDLYEVVSSKMP